MILLFENSPPYSVKLDIVKIKRLLFAVLFVFFLLFTTSLLFLKELHLNRNLHSKLLVLELENKVLKINSQTQETSTPSHTLTETTSLEKISTEKTLTVWTTAKVIQFSPQCDSHQCEVQIQLIPSSMGTVEGEMIVVLETEVKKASLETRQKKYILNPSQEELENLDLNLLSQKPGKKFKFSKSLQTQVTFPIGEFLEPLAVHLYILDTAKKIILHERKEITL